MATPTILTEAGWEGSVREALGYSRNDIDAIPDEQLRGDLMLQLAEDYIKTRVPTWADIMATVPSSNKRKNLIRAVEYYICASMADSGYAIERVASIEKGEATVRFFRGKMTGRTVDSYLEKVNNCIYLIDGICADLPALGITYPTRDIITGEYN